MNKLFRTYLEEAIGHDNALVAFSAFDSPASVSIRLNPFKEGCRFQGRPVPWSTYGMMLDSRPSFTLDPLFHCGAYYVQDSSSMFVGTLFRNMLSRISSPLSRPLRVLDLCAAPGGKTTDLASSLRQACGDGFVLVANEVMKSRVGILADNVALWGDPNVVVTSDDPREFASLAGYFDIVLADVPCSGEGMFRKDEQAQSLWSGQNVALCQARQRRIIADMWPCVASEGVLIYSTCTFNRYENDINVQWIADSLGAEVMPCEISEDGVIRTGCGYGLVPGLVEGEGQYCAALRKTVMQEYGREHPAGRNERTRKHAVSLPDGLDALFSTAMAFDIKGDTVTAVPDVIAAEVAMLRRHLHVISAGCAVGTLKGRTLVPDADMALSIMLSEDSFPRVETDCQTALAYLHRDPLMLPDAPAGFVLVCHEGMPLGFVKNIGTRCNNLHPQSRRIRMNLPKNDKS